MSAASRPGKSTYDDIAKYMATGQMGGAGGSGGGGSGAGSGAGSGFVSRGSSDADNTRTVSTGGDDDSDSEQNSLVDDDDEPSTPTAPHAGHSSASFSVAPSVPLPNDALASAAAVGARPPSPPAAAVIDPSKAPVLPTVIASMARRGSVALMAANMQRNMERQQRMQNQMLLQQVASGDKK